jgi:hypothetical protein
MVLVPEPGVPDPRLAPDTCVAAPALARAVERRLPEIAQERNAISFHIRAEAVRSWASSTASHRKGIALMIRLTSRSAASSPRRTSRAAELLMPQVGQETPPCCRSAEPTSNLKIDPR